MTREGELRKLGPIAAACLLLALSSCGGVRRSVYLDRDANFGVVERVALVPLRNLTGDPNAAERVERILTIELLGAEAFELLDPVEVRVAMADLGLEPQQVLAPGQVRALGERLGVQALMQGAVQEMGTQSVSGVTAPVVAIELELLDVVSGKKIWSAVASRSGPGTTARLFGVGRASTNEAIRDVVRAALRTLIR